MKADHLLILSLLFSNCILFQNQQLLLTKEKEMNEEINDLKNKHCRKNTRNFRKQQGKLLPIQKCNKTD